MKTLIANTDTSATYEFSHNGSSKTINYDRSKMMNIDPDSVLDFEAMSDADHAQWMEWVTTGDPVGAVNPLDEAESFVSRHYSAPRLLQMKVWWDTLPHSNVPKLAAVYEWANAITAQAAQGQTNFTEPPHAIEQLVEEAMGQLSL